MSQSSLSNLINTTAHEQQIDKLFSRYVGTPGCVIGVAQNGVLALVKEYGMANLDLGIPLSCNSSFYLASVSKQFTAMAVLLLEELGLVALEDSIRKTIPELPQYANSVTLRHLLNHTSGLDYWATRRISG